MRLHKCESRLSPSRRMSIDKTRKRLSVYPLIFYARARRDDQSGRQRDTIKLSDKRIYLMEYSQISNRFLNLRNENQSLSASVYTNHRFGVRV